MDPEQYRKERRIIRLLMKEDKDSNVGDHSSGAGCHIYKNIKDIPASAPEGNADAL
ncbi:MAG: hypothetical protein K0B52_03730 [FCB group bacterium]|nr:hypothetical protein [FCB group bacterium]